jgi:membrane complex biogenesis BtpA family protein
VHGVSEADLAENGKFFTMEQTAAAPENSVLKLFQKPKVTIGVVHCLPLPGAPRYDGMSMQAICDRAMFDAEAYLGGGLDGLIIENHGDVPFVRPDAFGPETAAAMAVITDRVRQRFDAIIGVNVLANAVVQALAVAKAGNAHFVRVNQWANAYVSNEGMLNGEAGLAMRYRSNIQATDVAIFADAHVKHGAHAIVADRSIEELTRDLEFFDADVAIATGQRTGDAVDLEELETIGKASSLPVVVGSGVNMENVGPILQRAAGVIIGSSLKQGGVWWKAVDAERVKAFSQVVARELDQMEDRRAG